MPTLIEKHLAYVDNATVSAQKRQQKLWKQVTASRGRGGILPLTDPVLDEYIEAVRMTASLMIDIEMVRDEYLAEKSGRPARSAAGGRKAPRKAAKKAAARPGRTPARKR
ncbi:MAG: hypothetical protein KJ041_05545 [Gammaproteobacteria bacterium]|nr:hypothetical protein [Gammaproteobacteria bacterium]